MTKTRTPTKGARKRAPRITDRLSLRAEAIVNDAKRYDLDTREAVAHAFNSGDAEGLADSVRRAERGEMILDTVAVQARHEQHALAVLHLIENTRAPGFIGEAIRDAIREAARRSGYDFAWTPETSEPDEMRRAARELGRLFAVLPPTFDLGLAVFHRGNPTGNPDTPADLTRVARKVLLFANDFDTPNFISEAVSEAIEDAGDFAALDVAWLPVEDEDGETERASRELARLLDALPGSYGRPGRNSPEALARDLAAVMANPSLPRDLYGAIYEAVNATFHPVAEVVDRSEPVILASLRALAQKGGDE